MNLWQFVKRPVYAVLNFIIARLPERWRKALDGLGE